MIACCQLDLLKIDGIEQAYCIDTIKIRKIVKEEILLLKILDKGKIVGVISQKI